MLLVFINNDGKCHEHLKRLSLAFVWHASDINIILEKYVNVNALKIMLLISDQ